MDQPVLPSQDGRTRPWPVLSSSGNGHTLWLPATSLTGLCCTASSPLFGTPSSSYQDLGHCPGFTQLIQGNFPASGSPRPRDDTVPSEQEDMATSARHLVVSATAPRFLPSGLCPPMTSRHFLEVRRVERQRKTCPEIQRESRWSKEEETSSQVHMMPMGSTSISGVPDENSRPGKGTLET